MAQDDNSNRFPLWLQELQNRNVGMIDSVVSFPADAAAPDYRSYMIYYNQPLLHANPDDEFSMGTIGPNDSIISNYCQIARREYSLSEAVYDEPIIVNKLERDGYLILNGHHRWAGAIMAHVPKVRIAIVNPGRR